MGQGLYTKSVFSFVFRYRIIHGLFFSRCCQIAAQDLGVPLAAVFTSETSSNAVPNTVPTAGSAGSDLQGYAVHNACLSFSFQSCCRPLTLFCTLLQVWNSRSVSSLTERSLDQTLLSLPLSELLGEVR